MPASTAHAERLEGSRWQSKATAARWPTRPQRDAFEVLVDRLDVAAEAVRTSAVLLSDVERQRASRFAFEHDRRRFVVARARLRQLIAARLRIRPEAVELTCGARGKPALASRYVDSDLRFNVSHSGDVVVFAFCEGRELGVDIERVRPMPDADEIASRFFSHSEYAAYRALPAHDKAAGFFNCWTRKEAFVKALGTGLDYPLDRFDVSLTPGEPARLIRVEGVSGKCCGWTLHALPLGREMAAALVLQNTPSESPLHCRIDDDS